MADTPEAQVSATEPKERMELPIPTASGASMGQPTSGAEADNAALRKKVDELHAMVKGLQSATDKGLSKAEKISNPNLDELLELASKHKGDRDAVMKEYLDNRIRQDYLSRQNEVSKPVQREGPREETETRVRKLFAKAEIEDESVMAEILKPLATREYVQDGKVIPEYYEDLTASIAKYMKGRVQQSQPANPAAVIQPVGGQATRQDLETAYRKEIVAARGKGAFAGNAIREKYLKAGLDVYSIGF